MGSKTKNQFFCTNSFPLKNRLSITVGSRDGIGLHVVSKSLASLKPIKKFQFVVWNHKQSPSICIKNFKTQTFKTAEQAFKSPFKENIILQIQSSKSPVSCLTQAAQFCLNKKSSALITGPVNKISMKKEGFVGQTDLLKSFCKTQNVFMTFRGSRFNVALLTDHIPLKKISISKVRLKYMLEKFLIYRNLLPAKDQNKPLGLLGLNPHAGEQGLLGHEENLLKPFLEKHFSKEQVEGPLVPDAAFLTKNWSRYSFYIALYHDQGLIPFKMIHKHAGFAISLGLPFLRLGVDHGTGVGLKKQDIHHESFLKALKESMRLINKKERLG